METQRSPRTVLITGASGFIGSALISRFAKEGWRAIGAGRTRPAHFPAAFEWRPYDLAWTGLPGDLLDGVDVLVHLAVARGDVAVNVAAGELLLDRARRAGVEQIVFLSSLAAHSDALSPYGKQKFALQRAYEAAAGALVIRPGLVLGSGGAFGAMCDYVRGHRFVPLIGGGAQPLQTVYIGDLVQAVYGAVERRLSGTFTVAEPEPVEYRAFYAELAHTLGTRPAFVPVPFWTVDLVLHGAALAHVRLPVDRDNLLGLRAMRADTGVRLEPCADYRDNIRRALAASGGF